jgi:hypothetical protein
MAIEFLRHAKRVPSLPLAKSLNVAAVAEARAGTVPAPSWMAVFMKAYGLVARSHPELRRALIPWPWPHLYEHPISECGILVEREWQGETVVLGAKVREPEAIDLTVLDGYLRRFKEAPVESISAYRQILRLGRLPGLLRRFTLWHSLYLSGYTRAKRFGTFMISSLGSLGIEQFHPLTPLTTYFTFGPISATGDVVVKVIYDHRVLDGGCVARCLNDLEKVLNCDLLAELRSLRRSAA